VLPPETLRAAATLEHQAPGIVLQEDREGAVPMTRAVVTALLVEMPHDLVRFVDQDQVFDAPDLS
jgi:hypothetical protein